MMRKLLFTLMALLFWAGSSFGQFAIIGTGTSTTNGFSADPIHQYYNYVHFQIVYTAAELTTAGMPSGASITGLGFSVSEVPGGGAGLANFTIDMGHTLQATANPYISTGLVNAVPAFTYSPVVQTAGNFDMIAFTTNFTWDGTSNIVVNTCTGSNPFTSPYGGLRYTTATSGAARYIQTDNTSNCGSATTTNTANRPNIRFDYTSTTPSLGAVPGSLAFGYIPSGNTSAEQSYNLSGVNLTAGPVVVTAPTGFGVSLASGGPYTASVNVTYTPPTLASTPIYVQFAPTGPSAAYSGNITNVGGGASANVAVTGTSDIYGAYCASNATSAADEDIFNVTVGTLNNTSDCSTTAPGAGSIINQYSNYFYDVTPTNLEQGSTNAFSVQIGTCGTSSYGNKTSIFIDFTQDGDFDDTGETVFVGTSTSGAHFETGNIVVPSGATLGNTMMRVVNVETSGTVNACGTYSWGETEDYKVNIVTATSPVLLVAPGSLDFGVLPAGSPSAEQTYALSGNNLTGFPDNITVTAPAGFEVSLMSGSGFAGSVLVPYTSGTLASTTIYVRFYPTAPSTTYDGTITNVGGGTKASANVAVIGASACGTVSVPYFENFDAVTAPAFPACMTVEDANADLTLWETEAVGLSAPNCARIYYNSSLAMDDWFFTEPLSLTGGKTYVVAFVFASSTSYPERLSVDWGTGASSTAMSGTPIFSAIDFAGGWYVGSGTFSPTITGTYYVGFHGHSLADEYYILVDDISVIEEVATTSWTGAVDNNWWDAGNWGGGLPTSATAVTIPASATNFPTVGAVAQCGSILVESGASLLDNGLLVTGSATVERDYSGGQWHLIGSPVIGETANTFFGLYLQTHDETVAASSGLSYTDVEDETTVLAPGQGYALYNASSATASFTGDLTYTATRALTRTATGYDYGWNLVGNPYPSSIDWNAVSGWTKTNVNATTYRLAGAVWATWNGTTGTNSATQYIASGQGFFVEIDDAQTSGTLGFANGVRVHDNTTFFKEEPADIVKLKVSGNNFTDEMAVYFRDEATIGYDGQMDAHQMPNADDMAPCIYSSANEGMAINVLPEVTSVPLNVKVGSGSGTYTIETVSNGEFTELYLEDISTGIIIDLNTNTYTFTYIPGIESRFVLHFGALGVDDVAGDLFNIYSFNKDVYVAVPAHTSGTITVYDMMGQEVTSTSINNTVNVITLDKSAYYIIKVLSNENMETKKVFIK